MMGHMPVRLTLLCLSAYCLPAADPARIKEAIARIDARGAELVRLSDQIWRYAETALGETRSAKALADFAEREGFRLERDVAGLPTSFAATYGSGRPVIGILAEYDALPGISQQATPVKEALVAGGAGHGCGHNLFGVASLGAALAVKESRAAGKLRGTSNCSARRPKNPSTARCT